MEALLKDEDTATTPSYRKIAEQFYTLRLKEDQKAAKFILDEKAKIFFNFLLKLSYGLFIVGVTLTIQSKAFDQQKFILYLQSSRSQAFLVVLMFLGVADMAILKTVKEENKISPAAKKCSNFIVDIVRATLYTVSLIFVQPFIYDNESGLLIVSFWTFVIAIALFIARKILKWKYFLFDEKGKKELGPWEGQNLSKEGNISKHAQLIDFIFNKKLEGESFSAEDLLTKQKIQRLKKIQEQVLINLEEEKNLLNEINNSIN